MVSNGLEGARPLGGSGDSATKTYRWNLDIPTATYLTTILIDRLTVPTSTLADGTPVVDAYSPGAARGEATRRGCRRSWRFLASKFGPYPAPAAGGLFVDAPVGFSLETFSRPVYTARIGLSTIVHENAHQWWGDNVSVRALEGRVLQRVHGVVRPVAVVGAHGVDLDAHYRDDVNSVDFGLPLYDMGPGHEFTMTGSTRRAPTSSTRCAARSATTRPTSAHSRASRRSSRAGT